MIKKLFSLFAAVLFAGSMWAGDFSTTYSYGGTNWTRTNFTDAGSYYKSDADKDCVATIPGIFTDKTITTDVVITLHVACFGNGDNPTETKFSIYNSSDCSSQIAATKGGTLPSSSSYTDLTYTVDVDDAVAGFTDDLAIKIAKGTKLIRLQSITVEFSYADNCSNLITITKADNPAHGTFVLNNIGEVCIDNGNATTTVTATPAAHYHLATVEATVGTVGTITGNTCEITEINANTTISVTFAEDTHHTVTWNVNFDEDKSSTSEVYEGEKPVFPTTTPSSFDATSTTFIGWATEYWTEKLANLTGKTVYTSAEAMPVVNEPVTYYAVFAKLEAGEDIKYLEETFDKCDGTGGNDGSWSGSIGTGTITTDVSGWSFENGGGASKCVKLGTGKAKGTANTPTVSLTGSATLTFKAAAWDGGSEGTTLNLSATGAIIDKSSVTLVKGEFSDYTVAVTNGNGTVKFTFAAKNASNNRFFLDEVVVSGPSTTISDYITTDPSVPTAIENTDASVKAVKTIVNGQLLIEKNGRVYNAFGQTVK